MLRVVLRKMNPEKVDHAISSMYSVWLTVAAVLISWRTALAARLNGGASNGGMDP